MDSLVRSSKISTCATKLQENISWEQASDKEDWWFGIDIYED